MTNKGHRTEQDTNEMGIHDWWDEATSGGVRPNSILQGLNVVCVAQLLALPMDLDGRSPSPKGLASFL
jgi:hypothetical protein